MEDMSMSAEFKKGDMVSWRMGRIGGNSKVLSVKGKTMRARRLGGSVVYFKKLKRGWVPYTIKSA